MSSGFDRSDTEVIQTRWRAAATRPRRTRDHENLIGKKEGVPAYKEDLERSILSYPLRIHKHEKPFKAETTGAEAYLKPILKLMRWVL